MKRWLPRVLVLLALAIGAGALVRWRYHGAVSQPTATQAPHQAAANEKPLAANMPAAGASPSPLTATSPQAANETILSRDSNSDLEAAARSGSLQAQSQLCSQTVSRDDAAATVWCEAAARGGDANAQFLYGGLVDVGKGLSADHEQATQWYERAAAQQHMQALYVLGKRYLGEDNDPDRGLLYLRRAAARGHTGALALLRERGEHGADKYGTLIQ